MDWLEDYDMAQPTADAVAARLSAHEKHCDERHDNNDKAHDVLFNKVGDVLTVVKANGERGEKTATQLEVFFGDGNGNEGAWSEHKEEMSEFKSEVHKGGRWFAGGILLLALLHLQNELGLIDIIKGAFS